MGGAARKSYKSPARKKARRPLRDLQTNNIPETDPPLVKASELPVNNNDVYEFPVENSTTVEKPKDKKTSKQEKLEQKKKEAKKREKRLTRKDIENFWSGSVPSVAPKERDNLEEDVEQAELGVVETFADYMPSKLKIGQKHPDPVVETATLSSVSPAEIWFQLDLPEDLISSGALSALQLEAIVYASQQHEHTLGDGARAGFLLGDGAGVGKGRTIAGLIYNNFIKGRDRAIWVSVSNDLKFDAERDLRDIGASDIKVHPLNKLKYVSISSKANGYIKKGVIFSTYASLISSQNSGSKRSRLSQLVEWFGPEYDGVIVFDECHRAKNLFPVNGTKPTKTGVTVVELQKLLPKARVLYASATGASEPRNMCYMVRLGIWGPGTSFPDFNNFVSAIEKRGVGAMEIVAMDMKMRGMYLARQLSFHGVTFDIVEVPLEEEFIKMYFEAVNLWIKARHVFNEAETLMNLGRKSSQSMWRFFWGAHQRFFKYLCIAAKVDFTVEIARKALQDGKCVVIGLQSTGEAQAKEQYERDHGEIVEFFSTAKGVFRALVEKHFPIPEMAELYDNLEIVYDSAEENEYLEIKLEADSVKAKSSKAKRGKAKFVKSKSKPNEPTNTSTRKRKSRRAATMATKKVKKNFIDDSDDESSESHSSDSDSDYCLSDEKTTTNKKKIKGFKHEEYFSDESYESIGSEKLSEDEEDVESVEESLMDTSDEEGPSTSFADYSTSGVYRLREELLEGIEELGKSLPPNTLDDLIDKLGGPTAVAEMTGRKTRVVNSESGVVYQSRSEGDVSLESLNVTEKDRFINGEKNIAIISEAASSGISLQSDKRFENKKRRVHITLELPWSADRAIQQFGRTHRSNQITPPQYVFLISELAGETRFASSVAKRLESLGALTHGDRRATKSHDLSQFNMDNKYGKFALEKTLNSFIGIENPIVPFPGDISEICTYLIGIGLLEEEPCFGGLVVTKDCNINKFFNRILGIPVKYQNSLFKYFVNTLEHTVEQAKKDGKYDLGILDLGGEVVKITQVHKYTRKHVTGEAATELLTVKVERGISFEEASAKKNEMTGARDGFYLSRQVKNGKSLVILIEEVQTEQPIEHQTFSLSPQRCLFRVFRPNTGLQIKLETFEDLYNRYSFITDERAESHWKKQFISSKDTCFHAFWNGNCRFTTIGVHCEVGIRSRVYYVLSGYILGLWDKIEYIFHKNLIDSRMRVVRLKTTHGSKLVGTLIPKRCIEDLKASLAESSIKVEHNILD